MNSQRSQFITNKHRARSRRKRKQNAISLRLPSKREVSNFREKRLLLHLHEQLCEQVEENPDDWQYHFHLANLLAFSEEYSYYGNPKKDVMISEHHYIDSLKLLKSLHETDYNKYKNTLHSTPISPFPAFPEVDDFNGCILYEEE
eukprot:275836_1